MQDGKAQAPYPATDPWVTSVGGTSIGSISGSTFTEWAQNDTAFAGNKQGASGGGVSDYFDGTQLPNQLQLVYAKRCRFLVQKSTFGSEEVDALLKQPTGGVFAQAFWVRIEGWTPAQLGINSPGDLAAPPIISQVTFNPSFPGLSVQFAGPVLPEGPSLPNQVQMFLFTFNASFAHDSGFTSLRR